MSNYESKTAKLYNTGMEVDQAVKLGADRTLFLAFEKEFRGGSIPVHLLVGFKPTPPHTSKYRHR